MRKIEFMEIKPLNFDCQFILCRSFTHLCVKSLIICFSWQLFLILIFHFLQKAHKNTQSITLCTNATQQDMLQYLNQMLFVMWIYAFCNSRQYIPKYPYFNKLWYLVCHSNIFSTVLHSFAFWRLGFHHKFQKNI